MEEKMKTLRNIYEILNRAMSDMKILFDIMADNVVLDYFGSVYTGKKEVLTFISRNLTLCTFEFESVCPLRSFIQISAADRFNREDDDIVVLNINEHRVDGAAGCSRERGVPLPPTPPPVDVVPLDTEQATSIGILHFPKRQIIPNASPKKIKYYRLAAPVNKCCEVQIGYMCNEDDSSLTGYKFYVLKFIPKVRGKPRNLLPLFNSTV